MHNYDQSISNEQTERCVVLGLPELSCVLQAWRKQTKVGSPNLGLGGEAPRLNPNPGLFI